MARDLPGGQIVPAARPVDSFIRPMERRAAAPAAPQAMPNPSGIRTIPQGSGGSFAGANQFAELATALAPFSSGLLKLADAGLERYASGEYQKGVNEAMRAQVLANQQILQSGAEFAGETRKLERTDPQGAALMDRVNPYREAGRVNALSRIAASEVEGVMLDEYTNLPDAHLLDYGDPKLTELKARAAQRLAEKYNLNQGTPGFIDYVLPQLGQSMDKVTQRHREDRQKYLKESIPRTAAAEMLGIYADAVHKGQVEWTEYDQATGQPKQMTATSTEPELFERGLQIRFTSVVNRIGNEAGLQGETSAFQRQALVHVADMNQGDERLGRLVRGTGVGPPGKDGQQTPAVLMFGPELLESADKVETRLGRREDRAWTRQQRAEEQGMDAFDRQAAQIAYEMPDGPEKAAAMQGLIQNFAKGNYGTDANGKPVTGPPLNPLELGERAVKGYGVGDDLTARQYSNDTADAWMQEIDTRVGTQWDPRAADKELEQVLRTAKPEDRDDLRRRYAEVRRRKENERDDVPSALVDPLISAKMKAELQKYYANDPTAAALRGADVTAMLAWGDANIAASAQRQLSAYRGLVYARLEEAKGQKGRKLTPAEVTSVTQKALADYGATDKTALKYLFPGSSTGEPSVGGARAQPPTPGDEAIKPPPGRQAFTGRVYPAGQLDNIPNRSQRLKEDGPVMELNSAQMELGRVLNGGAPSAPVSRAAKAAGMSVGRFLLKQLDAYPSFKLPPDARNQLLRSSTGAQSLGQRASSQGLRPLQVASNWFMNSITGTAPAAAATPPPMGSISFGSGGGRNGSGPFTGSGMVRPFVGVLGLLRSGEGGWDSANRGTAGDTPGGIPGLSRKTLGQWKQLQAGGYNALGAYQFIPKTLKLAAREAGISDSTVMTPAVQDRLAVQLMVGSKRPRLADYLRGKNNNLGAALDDLALEWASVHTARGGTAYAGIGGNAASISRSRAGQALQQARRQLMGGGGGTAGGGWRPAREGPLGSHFGAHESSRRKPHEGDDLGFASGTRLAFRTGGTVLAVYRTNSGHGEANGGYGSYMDVRLDNGRVVRLAHLGQIPRGLERNARFRPNQSIALTGGKPGRPGSGRSTGDHLHLEELSGPMGRQETTKGKLNPRRRGGALDDLLWSDSK